MYWWQRDMHSHERDPGGIADRPAKLEFRSITQLCQLSAEANTSGVSMLNGSTPLCCSSWLATFCSHREITAWLASSVRQACRSMLSLDLQLVVQVLTVCSVCMFPALHDAALQCTATRVRGRHWCLRSDAGVGVPAFCVESAAGGMINSAVPSQVPV